MIAAAAAFSWGFIIVKALALPPATVAFWRLVMGAGVLTAAAIILRAPWPADRLPVLIAGAAFGAHQLLYIAATQKTSVAIVTLLGATQPLLVALVSRRAIGEPVPRALFFWACLAVAGIAVVVHANLDDPSRSLGGDLLAGVNIVAFTIYFLAAKRARAGGAPTLTLTVSVWWLALVVVTPALILAPERAPGAAAGFGLISLLALGPGNGHLLVNWAHPKLSAALAALVLAAVPLLSSAWAHLVLGEPYGPRHVLGMLLVIAAIEGGRRCEVRGNVGSRPVSRGRSA